MSISYEEALATLEAMFSAPWNQETLDLVLRHFNGHMENTVDAILGHGDQSPQLLLSKLEAAEKAKADTAMDEQIARQLAQQQPSADANTSTSASSASSNKKLRGVPTTLPDDFLRIPGYKPTSAVSTGAATGGSATSTSADTLDSDEALARMLQDELFSQELARNPDFAHLARGRAAGVGNAASLPAAGYPAASRPTGRADGVFNARNTAVDGPQVPSVPEIVDKISELGNNARRKLALMAAQFKANTARKPDDSYSRDSGDGAGRYEMRGLLDDDNDAMELAARKDL